MSVPDDRLTNTASTNTEGGGGELFSRAERRALDFRASAEASGADKSFQLLPQLAGRFSLLPASAPPIEQREWSRENDYATIAITAGRVFDADSRRWVPGRLPGGGYSNLIMYTLLARVREQADRGEDPRRVDLTPTLNQFANELGLSRGGRQHKRLVEALQATLGASIQLYRADDEVRDGVAGVNLQMLRADIATSYSLWVPQQTALPGMEPFIEVSEFMVEFATAPGAIPVRLDILAQLAGKPLAQQAITWLAREVYVLDLQGKPERIFDWDDLYRNVTHDYTNRDNFQKAWRNAIDQALHFYPSARQFLDLNYPDPRDGRRKVIRLSRGAAPLVQPKQLEG